MSRDVDIAKERLIQAALRVLSAYHSDPHAHSGDEAEYADDLLKLAARDLAEATEASDRKPVGWERTNPADLAEGDWVTVTFRNARLSTCVYPDFANQGRLTLNVGHDAYGPVIPVVLTDDVTVVRVAEPTVAPTVKRADR